jgi:hypothetical protein
VALAPPHDGQLEGDNAAQDADLFGGQAVEGSAEGALGAIELAPVAAQRR